MKTIISACNLNREFVYFEKQPGLKGALTSLFNREKRVKTAVSNFNFEMAAGEFVGLIGPNGAGKTTLMKMMTGIIKPTSGELFVNGYRPEKLRNAFKRSYAIVMGQKSQLWWDLPAMDTFLLNKEIYGIPDEAFCARLDRCLELFDARAYLHQQVRKLSLGQRMKMEIIAAMLHGPEILFLDEPTIGLDMIAQKQMRSFLKDLNEQMGVSIILTSHYMEDIRHLCDRVVVISEGQKIYDGSYEGLSRYSGDHKRVHITVSEPLAENSSSLLLPDNCGQLVHQSAYKVTVQVSRQQVQSCVSHLLGQLAVEDIQVEDEDISDVIERLYTQKEAI